MEDLRNDVSWLQKSISEMSKDQMETCSAMSIICRVSYASASDGWVDKQVTVSISVNCTSEVILCRMLGSFLCQMLGSFCANHNQCFAHNQFAIGISIVSDPSLSVGWLLHRSQPVMSTLNVGSLWIQSKCLVFVSNPSTMLMPNILLRLCISCWTNHKNWYNSLNVGFWI